MSDTPFTGCRPIRCLLPRSLRGRGTPDSPMIVEACVPMGTDSSCGLRRPPEDRGPPAAASLLRVAVQWVSGRPPGGGVLRNPLQTLGFVVGREGLEPPTPGLKGRRCLSLCVPLFPYLCVLQRFSERASSCL